MPANGEPPPTFRLAHKHTVDFTTSRHENTDPLTALNDVIADIGDEVSPDIKRILIQVASLLVSLFAFKSWTSTISALVQFASGNDTVWKYCKVFVDRVPRVFRSNEGPFQERIEGAFAGLKDGFIPLWEAIVASCSITVIAAAFKDMASWMCDPIMDQLSRLRIAVLATGTKSIAESIVLGISSLLKRLRSCIKTRSFAPLWGPDWDPQSMISELEALMAYYPVLTTNSDSDVSAIPQIDKLRKDGVLPAYWTTPVSTAYYLEIAQSRLDVCHKMTEYFASSPVVCRALTAQHTRFRNFITLVIGTAGTVSMRQEPILLFYHGVAGTGKSNFAKQVAKAMGNHFDFDVSDQGTHYWDPKANFQDGLNHTKWHVMCDDIDQTVAPDVATIPNSIEVVIKLVNNVPYMVEQAAVELKGRIRANPVLVSYCTNYANAKVPTKITDPNAFWRRINMHVEVKPLPQYSNGESLDKTKAAEAETHDMFELHVRYYDPKLWNAHQRDGIPLTPPVIMGASEFCRAVMVRYVEHRERQHQRLKEMSALSSFCESCGLDRTRTCSCVTRTEVAEPLPVDAPTLELEGHCDGIADKAIDWYNSVKERVKYAWDTLPARTNLAPVESLKRAVRFGLSSTFDRVFWLGFSSGLAALGAALLVTKTLAYYVSLEGRAGNATGIVPPNWFRAEQTFRPGVPHTSFSATHTFDDLLHQVKSNYCYLRSPSNHFHGFLLGHNSLLTATHICALGEELTVTYNGMEVKFTVTAMNRRLLGNPELCIITNGNLYGGAGIMSKIWKCVDESIMQFDECILLKPDIYLRTNVAKIVNFDGNLCIQSDMPSEGGDCGSLYACRFGNAWWITAVHYAGMKRFMTESKWTLGGVVTQLELTRCASSMAVTLEGVQTVRSTFTKSGDFSVTHYPGVSEVWTAKTQHDAKFYPVGCLDPPLTGSTMKTKVRPSLIAPDFADLAELWTGQKDYWRLPDFRGKMVDEKWVSPYTKPFETQNWITPDLKILWLALADYLHGMEELGNEGYSELSEEQIIAGVAGSYIHGANLKTSVGPPFNKSKRAYVYKDEDGAVFIDEVIWKRYDEIDAVLEAGYIPTFIGVCTLKDEALKPGKYPRIFTNIPFAANMHFKGVWSPLKCFVRAHFLFFESAVGINMTSSECNKIPKLLATVDPTLQNIDELDVVALDKSWSGVIFDFVAYVYYAIAMHLGIRPHRAMALVFACKYTRLSIKNDLFCIPWNISGQNDTVEFNSHAMSMAFRYVYYKKRAHLVPDELVERFQASFLTNPVPSVDLSRHLSFRVNNALVTYGDDSLRASREPSPDSDVDIWRQDLGLQVTDAAKTGSLRSRPLSDCSFLKREFVWDEELKSYLPPLSVKSMARTLMIKKESTLTDHDHAATAMSEVMREAVYHGKEFYEEFKERCDLVAAKHNLLNNPLYVSRTYTFWREMIANNNFQTWTTTSVQPPVFDSHDFYKDQ